MMLSFLFWLSLAASPVPAQERFPEEREMPRRAAKVAGEAKNVRLVGRWPYGPAYAVVIQGRYAYLGSGGVVFVLDISDPSSPRRLGGCATPGIVEGLFVSGDYLYVADRKAGLRVIDISDPYSPREVGAYDTPGRAWDVHVSGSYAYVADGYEGLRIIDISDPYSPREVGACGTPGYARGVHVSGSYAYVADEYEGLRIIDISDPSYPEEVGAYDTPGRAWDVHVSGSYAYVADAWEGLRIIDISDPYSPKRWEHTILRGVQRLSMSQVHTLMLLLGMKVSG